MRLRFWPDVAGQKLAPRFEGPGIWGGLRREPAGNARAFRETGASGNVSGFGHPVPHPGLGENVGGTPGVVAKLAPEGLDEGLQNLGVA